MNREDLGHTARFKFAKINSEDLGLCVRAVVRGRYTGTVITSDTPTPKAWSKSGSSVTVAAPAA